MDYHYFQFVNYYFQFLVIKNIRPVDKKHPLLLLGPINCPSQVYIFRKIFVPTRLLSGATRLSIFLRKTWKRIILTCLEGFD